MDELTHPPVEVAASNIGSDRASAPLVRSLLSISKSTRAFLALLLAEIDLHLGQDQLIECLEPGEPLSVSELADRLAVRPSTVSKMLDRLFDKNLVCRTVSTTDARRTLVTLTPAGEKLKPAIDGVWTRLEQELCSAMSPDEAKALQDALSRIDTLLTVKLRRRR